MHAYTYVTSQDFPSPGHTYGDLRKTFATSERFNLASRTYVTADVGVNDIDAAGSYMTQAGEVCQQIKTFKDHDS